MMMTTMMTIIRMTWILPFVIVSEMQLSDGLRKWRIQIWNSSSNFLQIWNHQKSLLSFRNILNSMQKYLRVHLATENSPTVLFVEIFNFLYSSLNKWAAIENTHSIAKKMVNSTYIAILIPCCRCAGPSAKFDPHIHWVRPLDYHLCHQSVTSPVAVLFSLFHKISEEQDTIWLGAKIACPPPPSFRSPLAQAITRQKVLGIEF